MQQHQCGGDKVLSAHFVLFSALIFGILSSSTSTSAADCNWEVKNSLEKYRRSPIVIAGRFLGFTKNLTDPRVMLVANFRLETILKHDGRFLTLSPQSLSSRILQIPLYRGHAKFSKRTWCMNDHMLRSDKRYVLFLNYYSTTTTTGTSKSTSAKKSRGGVTRESLETEEQEVLLLEPEAAATGRGSGVGGGQRETVTQMARLRSVFLPDGWSWKLISTFMTTDDVQGDSSSSSAEIPVLPIYEVELDLENVDGRTKRAEIEPDSGGAGGVQLRCTVKGPADEQDPQLGWNYDGSVLTTTKEGIQVETDNLRCKFSVEYRNASNTSDLAKRSDQDCRTKTRRAGGSRATSRSRTDDWKKGCLFCTER